jgi:glycosyltransferase involved in cell wall biosynthesis
MSCSNVVFFSSLLLPPSQTFIRAQGEELRQFTPYYVGSRLVKGLDLPPDRTLVLNQGGWQGRVAEGMFKLSGVAPQFQEQIKHLNPVLIHAQFGLSGALAMPLARSLKLPLLVHFRGSDATEQAKYVQYNSLNHWIYFRRQAALKRETRLFLTVSKFIKEKLLEQAFPPNKIMVHYSGIDVAAFEPDRTLPREPVVLFVGRLTQKKGCEYLIRAMAQVQAVLPDVELVMIGDGELRPELEALAASKLHRYQFLGIQPQSTVKDWMNRARLLAAPSITAENGNSEGLPNVVLEAQAMGLPVISTLHAGIPEGVLHGETGFLAPERDADKLAEHSLRLLQDLNLWQSFSTKGQAHVRAGFDRRKQTRILESLYEAVLRKEI